MLFKQLLLLSLVAQVTQSKQVPFAGADLRLDNEQHPPKLAELEAVDAVQTEPHNSILEIAPTTPATVANSEQVTVAPSITGPVAINGDQIGVDLAIANSSQIEASPISDATSEEDDTDGAANAPNANANQPVAILSNNKTVTNDGVQITVDTPANNTVNSVQLEVNPSVNITSSKVQQVEVDSTTPNSALNKNQIEANTIADVVANKPSNGSGLIEDESNKSNPAYELNQESCGSVIPLPILNMTLKRILSTISSQNCSEKQELKLHPNTNKVIRDRVMEVSSMPIDLSQITGAVLTKARCLNKPEEFEENGEQKVRLFLELKQDLGDQKLRSRWRHYPRFQNDELPFKAFSSGDQFRPQKTMSKCQRFNIETGDYYLELLSFKTSIEIQVTLSKLDTTDYEKVGAQMHVSSLIVNELYLDHAIHLGRERTSRTMISNNNKLAGSISSLNKAFLPTVQIFHDQNNHHRRNNWLLDMYGNWLQHEYKLQLTHLFGKPLVDGLNSCLIM